MQRGLHTKKKTCKHEKKPFHVHVKRPDLQKTHAHTHAHTRIHTHSLSLTHTHIHTHTHMKRDLRKCKETQIYEKRPTYMKRDLDK